MSDLTRLSLIEAKAALANKSINAVELTQAHIDKMDEMDGLNIYITKTPEHALEQAQLSDDKRAKGQELGLMEGLPIANKDLFCTKGVETTAASRILQGFIPPYESTITQNLKNHGAISLGKVNLDEFAMGSSTETSYFGASINPWRRKDDKQSNLTPGDLTLGDLTPGGSSGGSAAIVAGFGALAATGTDTGGSIRQPASFCGIVGMKPTYGRCSRWGTVAFASSLDQAGPMTRTVKDAALMLQAMAGHDAKDATSVDVDVPDFLSACKGEIKGMKIGLPVSISGEGMDKDIADYWQKAAKWLEAAGAHIIEISLDYSNYALPAYYIIAPAEASSNLARYDGVRYGYRAEEALDLNTLYSKTRAEGFGAEVKRRIMMGTYVLSSGYYDAYYRRAQKLRTLIAQDFNQAFHQCDVILMPSTPTSAFPLHDKQEDPIKMYLNDIFTVPVNMAGLPAMSLPVGLDKDGLPVGLQLIAPAFEEQRIFNAASFLEMAADFTANPYS